MLTIHVFFLHAPKESHTQGCILHLAISVMLILNCNLSLSQMQGMCVFVKWKGKGPLGGVGGEVYNPIIYPK